jgi:transcriptional regulator with XRE-family HTH domain
MMKKEQHISLEDVIDAYVASSADSGEDTLATWVESYPQYASELRDFAAHYKLFKHLPERAYTAEEEELINTRAASVVQNLLYRRRAGVASADDDVTGLINEAEMQNLSLEQFAEATGLSAPIIAMLDRRQVRYESIPRKVIDNIAQAIRRAASGVASYLQGEMRLQPAHYRADEAPRAVRLQEFSALVAIDPELSASQRKQWLELAASEGGTRSEQGDERREPR